MLITKTIMNSYQPYLVVEADLYLSMMNIIRGDINALNIA